MSTANRVVVGRHEIWIWWWSHLNLVKVMKVYQIIKREEGFLFGARTLGQWLRW